MFKIVSASLLGLLALSSVKAYANSPAQLLEESVQAYHQADYNKALADVERVAQIAKETQNTPLFVVALNNVAALQSITNANQALQTYQQALDLTQKMHGANSLAVATIVNNMGSAYKSLGNHEQAIAYYQQALSMRESLKGNQWIENAESLNNLGSMYKLTNQFAKAESVYQQALSIQRTVLGETHPEIAVSLNNLATLYHQQQKTAQASAMYQQAIDMMQRIGNADNVDTAKVMFNYAVLLKSQQQWSEAESVLLKAGPIFDRKLGKKDSMSIKTLEQLADIQLKTGQTTEANRYFELIAQRKETL